MATNMTASELMDFMSEIFSTYDALAKKYNVELIKTIGDAYFACAGLKPITTEEDAQGI
jgi:adenylate cyclase